MSAYGMKPLFTDKEGYFQWRKEWKTIYSFLSEEIKKDKKTLSVLMQERHLHYGSFQPESGSVKKFQKELVIKRAMARKVMTLLEEAKLRRDRILKMHHDLAEQKSFFPLELNDCRNIDFHYNKVSNEFSFMPMWVLKVKGRQFLINDLISNIGFKVKNTPDKSTRGSLRIPRGSVNISKDGSATINAYVDTEG